MSYEATVTQKSERDPHHAPSSMTGIAPEDLDKQPAWLAFELPDAVGPDGARLPVTENAIALGPFAVLSSLSVPRSPTSDGRPAAKVLIVMAMSGHYAPLIYDLTRALLTDHDVFVLDWINARHIPACEGPLSFEATIETIICALDRTGPETHLIGLCQSTVPAIAAATTLTTTAAATRPRSLILMGGPVDPFASPSRVAMALAMTPLSWFDLHAVTKVASNAPGAGRRVYPARSQHHGLILYLQRHLAQDNGVAAKLAFDDGALPQQYPFLAQYTRIKDIPAEAFLGSIDAIYKRRALWHRELEISGVTVDPPAVRNLPLLTIEAPADDIACPGQTRAAHRLFAALPGDHHWHHELSAGGHFALAHGRICREEVAPAISAFIARFC